MASEVLKVDQNNKPVIGFVTDDANQYIKMGRIDDSTKGLKVMIVGGLGIGIQSINSDTTSAQVIAAGSGITVTDNGTGTHTIASTSSGGSVTSASVVTANGFAGTVATATTTPAITLTTSINGILQGDGTAISAKSSTGSGNIVLATSPTLVTPLLGTPTSGVATNLTGLPLTSGVTGVLPIANGGTNTSSASITAFNNITGYTASGATGTTSTNLVFSTSPTLVTPILGTPTSATLTNATGLPVATGISGLGTGIATFLGTPSSANLASALTDETGTGKAVFASKPTFIGTVNTIATVSALALDGSLGSIFTKTIAVDSTFTQSNFSTGQCFLLKITGVYVVTFFSGVTWLTSGGVQPTQGAITTYGFTCTGANTFDGYLVGTQ